MLSSSLCRIQDWQGGSRRKRERWVSSKRRGKRRSFVTITTTIMWQNILETRASPTGRGHARQAIDTGVQTGARENNEQYHAIVLKHFTPNSPRIYCPSPLKISLTDILKTALKTIRKHSELFIWIVTVRKSQRFFKNISTGTIRPEPLQKIHVTLFGLGHISVFKQMSI